MVVNCVQFSLARCDTTSHTDNEAGRMLVSAANLLGIKVVVLDNDEACPANQINPGGFVKGSFKDPDAIKTLAKQVDIITIEIEHVDAEALQALVDEKNSGRRVIVQPHPATIRTILDKFEQKEYLLKRGIPVAKSVAVEDQDFEKGIECVGGFPCMLKSRFGSYDGYGNAPLRSESDLPEAIKALGGRALYIEAWVPFEIELAVMVVKTVDSPADWMTGTLAFPVVETIHDKDQSIVRTTDNV